MQKNFAVAKSEHTLRALLGMPPQPLAKVAEAPAVKIALGKLLSTFSVEEREEVTSGRWIGLSKLQLLGVDIGDGTAASTPSEKVARDIAKLETDKEKLIKSIANSVDSAVSDSGKK